MRILFVVHQFYPEFHSGTESVTLHLAKVAQCAGHEVEILTSLVSQNVDPSWSIDEATGFYHYNHHDIAIAAIRRSDIPDEADYSLETHGPLVEKISVFLKDGQFDCCHVMHTMRMASAVEAIIENNIPYLLTITDFFLPCYRVNLVNASGQVCKGAKGGKQCLLDCSTKEWDTTTLELRLGQGKEIIEAATAVVCPSGFVADHLRQEYTGVSIKVVPHDVNLQVHSHVENEHNTSEAVVFGYVGSVIEEKGLDLLIDAFCDAFDERDNVEVSLKVIGAPPVGQVFGEDILTRAAADPRIEFVGLIPHSEIESILQSIDVLCIPSRVPETFSLVLHEAATMGVPALVSNMGAIAQTIQKSGGGMVIENYDLASWSSVLRMIQEDPSMLIPWKKNIVSLSRKSGEAHSYLGLYRLAMNSGSPGNVMYSHAPEVLNWKKQLKRFLWPKFQVRGKAKWFLLALEYWGRSVRMLAILKRFLLRRPIPRFLLDEIAEIPPEDADSESIKFKFVHSGLDPLKYCQSLLVAGSGYSLKTVDPLFIDAYVDDVFQKRFHASSMQSVESTQGGAQRQYNYDEDLELPLTQIGSHQLKLVVQDISGNILTHQIEIIREPDPKQNDEYYRAGVPDVAERKRLDDLINDAVIFEIWVDASSDQDLIETLNSLLDQGTHKSKLQIYGLTQERRSDIEGYLAKVSGFRQFDIGYDRFPGDLVLDAKIDGAITYCVYLKAGEYLSPYALCQAAEHLTKDSNIDLVYTDHDLVDSSGLHVNPQFSPVWSPDYFLQHDYIGGVFFLKRTRWLITCLQKIDDFTRIAWRYKLLLNCTDWPLVIDNIPKIMWSKLQEHDQTEIKNGLKVVESSLTRRGERASVESSPIPGRTRVHWHSDGRSRVSIIIPTTGNLELLKPCLDSIIQKTSYSNFELVIIVNGQGRFPEGIEYCNSLGLRTIVDDEPFNWSRLNNRAVADCNGDLFLFLNDDIEVLNDDWLQSMVSLAERTSVGTVGSMLLYPDGTIQHAGVVLVDHGGGAMHYFQWMDPEKPIYNNLHKFTREVSASTGACLMVRREIYLEAGGFTEKFQISGNDIDFCLKVQELGYRNLWTPDARLIHKESMTRMKNKIPFPDEARMWKLWGERFLARDPFYSSNFTNQAAVCELPIVTGFLEK